MSKKIASITIENDHTEEVLQALKENEEAILFAWGEAAEGFAKEEVSRKVYDTPESPYYKRTGHLRDLITHETSESEHAVYIGTNVEYAPYVELGTSRMAARPFLKPAVTEHIEDYKAIMKDIISG